MAKRSNKTAHVLNLLAGNDAKKDVSEQDKTSSSAASPAAAPQNISVIDTTSDDPVSNLIQQQLSAEFENHSPDTSEQTDAPNPEPEIIPEAEPVGEPEAISEAEPAGEPEAAPKPAFVLVDVMREIVEDKIIYFMRQFDVCTCDRCVADTIALTLNGLAPKYIVVDPDALPPLLSFYTNKYIVDITVEATKACAAVKENPRH